MTEQADNAVEFYPRMVFSYEPTRQRLGESNDLVDVKVLAKNMGVSNRAMLATLRGLRIPLVYLGSKIYVNSIALDKALYYCSRHGGPGFAASGTAFKSRMGQSSPLPLELTDEDLERMNEPLFVAEWLAIRTRGAKATISFLKQLQKERKQGQNKDE